MTFSAGVFLTGRHPREQIRQLLDGFHARRGGLGDEDALVILHRLVELSELAVGDRDRGAGGARLQPRRLRRADDALQTLRELPVCLRVGTADPLGER